MPEIGQTLSHYRILEKIGVGGMGEVYLAEDTSLDRKVALKFLPEAFISDPERMARFEREAKLLASLNHPNIAGIHGLEQADGNRFLVLEYVEGETLQARISKGALPLEDALSLCRQIAEGLEAAHEKGVIHRDLKPANVMIAAEEKVKILDFGLAKAFAEDSGDMNLSNSPTLSVAATQQGVILGTAAYMSPEQARGKSVDKRADVWAFGVVLFEMLTGRSVFAADDVSSTLARVLEREPDFSVLPQSLHPRIRLLLERCLKKEPRNRYSGISDARVDIQEVLADPRGILKQTAVEAESSQRPQTGLLWAAGMILMAIIAGSIVWFLRTPPPPEVVRFAYELPEGQQFSNLNGAALAVSPDGKQYIYSTQNGIYLRSIDELGAQLIVGTDQFPTQPFFSPNGQWIGYLSDSAQVLRKITIGGGAPETLCKAYFLRGARWNLDNKIVHGSVSNGIMQVSADGGTPKPLLKAGSQALSNPQILPDGESMLFSILSPPNSVMLKSPKSDEPVKLFDGDSAQYLPTGHIVYGVGNSLYAVPFDPEKLKVSGNGVPVLEGILRVNELHYAISDMGTLIYIPAAVGAAATDRTLVWVDREGNETPLNAPPNPYRYPKLSPDGTKVAITILDGKNSDIYIWDLVRETMSKRTFDEGIDQQSIWTPDGEHIVFCSNREGSHYGVYWKDADGSGTAEHLGSAPDRGLMPWSWSHDGKSLLLVEIRGGPQLDIGMLSMEGDRARTPLLQDEYPEIQPKISPDGQWMAYASNESDQLEVYVRPFPEVDGGGQWQVSTEGGDSPLWSPDGQELFYRSRDSVMAVPVKTKPVFEPGNPKTLFRGPYVTLGANEGHSWDISPDGKRFLMMKDPGLEASGGPRKINIVLNWFEELKEKVPAD